MAGNSHFFNADEITNARETLYDGFPVMAAANGEYYDIESYGESWYQIPENVSKPHHVWAVDLNTPYSEHLDKLGDYFDLDVILTSLRARKQLKLEEQVRFKDAIVTAAKIKNLAAGMSAEKKYSELEGTDLAGIVSAFEPYYIRQLHKENKWYHLTVPVSDAARSAALLALSRMGEFAKVIDILDIAGENGIASLDEIHRHTEISRKLMYAIYVYPDTLEDTYADIVNGDLYETAKKNLSLYEAAGRIMLKKMRAASGTEKSEIAEELSDFADKHTKEFGRRTELMILKAYAVKELESQGRTSEGISSHDIFSDVLDRTYNGFIVQEALDEGLDLPERTDEPSLGFTSDGTDPGSDIIHYYVSNDKFESLKKDLYSRASIDDNLEFEEKGSGDKQRIILYDKRYLASSLLSVMQKKIDTMTYRSIWHIAADGIERSERRKVMVFADNITPVEFIARAESEGILNEKSAASYKEYRAWIKDYLEKEESVLDKYNREFLEYMDKVNGDAEGII